MVRLRIFEMDRNLTERLSMTATDLGNRISMVRNRISDYTYRVSDVIIHKTKVPFTIGMIVFNTTSYSFIGYHTINDSLEYIGMSKESLKKAGMIFGGTAAVCSFPAVAYGLANLMDRYRRKNRTESYENRA